MQKQKGLKSGVGLIEALVGTAILAMIFTFVIGVFVTSTDRLSRSKMRVLATALANEQLETIRNLSFNAVGTQSGVPSGNIPQTQTITRSNIAFTVTTRVDWVDDPFDGVIPADTTPTDYKKAEVQITWPNATASVKLTSSIAPQGVEAPANTGSLLVSVFDASGLPVADADVRLANSTLVPAIDLTRQTDGSGNYQFIGYPPDADDYVVTVSKAGYTTDATIAISGANPNPIKPNVSILANAISTSSFAIDQVASLAITTKDDLCQPLGNISFNLRGQKLIGNPPPTPILEFDQNFTTDGAGARNIANLEWDNYQLTLGGTSRNLIGLIPPASLNVLPGTNAALDLIMSSTYNPQTLLANLKDANTGLAISGATIRVQGGVYDETKTTGQGAWAQTTWIGGAGQADFTDATMFESADANIDPTTTGGQVTLTQSSSSQNLSETFSTTSNRDGASTTAVWDTGAGELRLPQTAGVYDASAQAQSSTLSIPAGKVVRATLTASDNANGETIQYALTANGINFEDVTPGVEHTFVTTGNDFRFRVSLATGNGSITPTVDSLSIQVVVDAYAGSGTLTSSSFDTGTPSTFVTLSWNPESQPVGTGADSVRFQLATNDDNATWNYAGPDGTAGTYYTISGTPVAAAQQTKRYIRYRLFLQTADPQFSPGVSDVAVGYTSGCTPPGQSFFDALSVGTYTVTISKTGYNPFTQDVDVDGNEQETFSLSPS
ncbi:MAG: carboxypeptidase regulatory-like domain-containing protein [Patescibacteria group bacterium]|jgi:type II secretory pathway pseudopilin PulG